MMPIPSLIKQLITPAKKLDKLLKNTYSNFEKEREKFRKHHSKKNPDATDGILIIADSLGLPRPNETSDMAKADLTYSGRISAQNANVKINSLCQRFFTTSYAVSILKGEPELCSGMHVLIHLGLNDCANRMFLENERLALSLYKKEIADKIVSFAQKYRHSILEYLPSRHYTDIETFRKNLLELSLIAHGNAAKSLTFTSIILPPSKFWPGTAGINQNFMKYNHAIAEATSQNDINLFDYDRHAWEHLSQNSLLDDGMHLSTFGHNLFSTKLSALLKIS